MVDKTASPRTCLKFGRHAIHALLATTALSGILASPVMAQDPAFVRTVNTHGNSAALANGSQKCTWPIGGAVGSGNTIVGFVHTADQNDQQPMYPGSIYDDAGNSYNMSPGVTWSPFPEPIGIWYLVNIQGNPSTITLDYTNSDNNGKVLSFCDAALFEYSNVSNIAIVNPVLEDGPSASLTISTPNPSLIWAFAAIYTNTDTTLIANSGFSVLDDNFGDSIEVAGSNGLVPAGNVTLTWNFPQDAGSTCAATGASDCPGLFMAAALYGDNAAAPTNSTDPSSSPPSTSSTDPSVQPASASSTDPAPPPAPPQRGHHHHR